MKRVEFNEIGSTEVLNIVEREIPIPKENEIVIKVKTAGLNRAEELLFQGQYLFQPKSPSLLDLEAAGIIEKVGSKINNFEKRDEVCLIPNITPTEYGFLGEYAVAPLQAVIKKTKWISFKESAAIWMTCRTAYADIKL
ncbi:alcohol dehydrogenase catalytic domain-containing protein [Kordia jejudonensis]|uniref:alcohol dehydrogenase catalytic domain-containing protein n=1 Tax=Kordia jejudonensis TaxID=1348245 RepID=UPI00069AE224|nr:alcohol dehydrogenase catalytic domain-containing protein [Kordia jejudonensis]